MSVPELRLIFAFEEPGQIVVAADNWEDERRLRSWLRQSSAFAALPQIAVQLLDDLDEIDAERAT